MQGVPTSSPAGELGRSVGIPIVALADVKKIDVDVDGDTATATTDYLFVRPTTDGLAIIAAGRYYDRLIRDETRWRFRERSITMLPAAAGGSDG